ncbi:gamma-glutamyltranspeptidase/glutathione hydrolase [Rhodobium orientis]|uniref:Gamma-glutamyltransferase n=1 Tax=Rhodobium orientis TaxID=34017 RepID=A0A327JWT6_9HYPH|nr:gamma-glutamyltransferase family protein [Rhodobium orientis]MBB4301416.1 gamma-glutamyltranspeptidase/glutathione hydrolase [Rhodobium orientis]MBK5950996.1 gamma-glutamyltransferase [Rhodobium orientis]RAI27638.1 gamma-glutamyltransferase [Rhodobium orientis]
MQGFDYHAGYPARRSPVMAGNVVATSQPLAAQAGLRMLLAGGNAVDAALAAAITLVVVEPTGNGLGSDAFAIVWDGEELHGLNASGRSPRKWSPERFAALGKIPKRGWESVTVPGAVSGWQALSARFGALPFADLFAPAIAYAENGFPVSPSIASRWGRDGAMLAGEPGFAAHFLPGGKAPAAGGRFRSPALARSLRLIAETKGEAFYRGELARRIAEFARRNGAALDEEDMAAHSCDWCGTLSQSFGDVALHEIPPNGQGIAALIALGILEALRDGAGGRAIDLATMDPDGPPALHLQIEAMKLALADAERHVSDPAAMRLPPDALLDPAYLRQRAALIDPDRARIAEAGAPRAGGTVYVAAADAAGRMVSLIQSNFAGFGSGVVVPDTGISLQNRGWGFTLEPGHVNEVAGGRRPFHTIIPGFVTRHGKPAMTFGVMGGPMQAQGHLQMVLRTQVWGQNPQMAADAPRWRFEAGRRVAMERGFPPAVAEKLAAMGHDISLRAPEEDFGFGGAQLIHRLEDGYVAGSDYRKDGQAVGF